VRRRSGPVTLFGRTLVLRPFRREELDDLWRGHQLARRAHGQPTPPGAYQRLRGLVVNSGRLHRGIVYLAIEVDGRRVGEIEARQPSTGLPPGVFELGISLAEGERGRGYGTEAVELLTSHLFAEGAHRVQASTSLENRPMQRVLEKAGFEREGILRGFLPPDAPEDYVLYGITRRDWEARGS
jgi:RimJ/RimL family protein N-acetyltransferase